MGTDWGNFASINEAIAYRLIYRSRRGNCRITGTR